MGEDLEWIFAFEHLDFELYPKHTMLAVFLIRFGFGMLYGEKDYHPD